MDMDPVKNMLNLRQRIAARMPTGGDWYKITSKDGGDNDTAEIRIYDYVDPWGVTAASFVAELDEITASNIVVAISSPGGDIWDCLAIYNALRLHPAKVTTRVDALAASGGSIIAQAGDHRQMVAPSKMMIHKSWGIFIGNADEARSYATLLDQVDDTMAGIYAERSGDGRKKNHFTKLMAAETWLSHTEAVDEGLADEVLTVKADKQPAAASLNNLAPIDWDQLLARRPAAAIPPDPAEEREAFLAKLLDAL